MAKPETEKNEDIDDAAQYGVVLARPVEHGPTLLPRGTEVIMLGSVLRQIMDAVESYAAK